MRRTKSFEHKDFQKDKKIIVYGAGRYGELAYWGLQAMNLQVDFFVDRNRAGETYLGAAVLSPEELKQYTQNIILIASYNYFNEILSYVESIGAEYVYDILTLLTIKYDESILSEYLRDEKHNYKKYQNVIENVAYEKFVINHCEVVVTECCSLKCRDCANLMQYYEHPEKISAEEIIFSFGNFLNTIDDLLDLRLLGGEPFIYKDLDKIIDAFGTNEKVKRITVYTNSTVLPSESVTASMKANHVVVHMSNYGKASRKVKELEELLIRNGIEYYIHEYQEWHDVGGVQRRNFSEKALQKIFDTCIMATCYSFYRGKFYLCPRAAHGERLGLFSNPADEFVDFTGHINLSEKRKELQELVIRRKYLVACDYCNGSSLKSKSIPAAIQCKN